MAHKVFYSFHFDNDSWRAGTVRGIGKLEGNEPVSENDWEDVQAGGDAAIEAWIANQMIGKDCLVVLIGSETAERKWIKYEIKYAWEAGLGVMGIHVHNLLDAQRNQTSMGQNPFRAFNVGGEPMTSLVTAHNPKFTTSTYVYNEIAENIEAWVADAINSR
ncbi:hypothetical protein BKA04_000421 [Cryobacterium mesophilum]|uniref:Thoeris protein ThsB TIR-like domain-containing protein n=1 Tax=Terrimesophilobacter mesophilus TaxID=433647 RepID=A0A4R8V8B1_9MICO|nr:TIR domain-containing protein [Terrimesophilobacter mesophilus]MBB5632198.1 hypothetical protein [Terrimesophilobacter mesophilus]TFB79059.1 hypothetical protein E3N84_02670 [Terrimesophilobacter mesophilus]